MHVHQACGAHSQVGGVHSRIRDRYVLHLLKAFAEAFWGKILEIFFRVGDNAYSTE
jgi:hypothetical protein